MVSIASDIKNGGCYISIFEACKLISKKQNITINAAAGWLLANGFCNQNIKTNNIYRPITLPPMIKIRGEFEYLVDYLHERQRENQQEDDISYISMMETGLDEIKSHGERVDLELEIGRGIRLSNLYWHHTLLLEAIFWVLNSRYPDEYIDELENRIEALKQSKDEKPLGKRERNSLMHLIGALKIIILNEDVAIPTIKNQSELIQYLVRRYHDYDGMSLSKIEQVFAITNKLY